MLSKKNQSKQRFKSFVDGLPEPIEKLATMTKSEKLIHKVHKILDHNSNKTLSTMQRKDLLKYLQKYDLPEKLRSELWLRGCGAKTLIKERSNKGTLICLNIFYRLLS